MSMRQLKITKSITNRESQSLEKYLQEIGKVELISSEEEVRLAALIRQGCQKSLDRLTKANLRFVGVGCKAVPKPGTVVTRPDQ
jgi:RNA polymerase primary sigma factor